MGGFEAWYRREHPRLLTAMVVVCGDLDVARDVTEAEVADAMGVSVGTVSSSLSVARRRLATLLADTEEVPRA